MLVPSGAGAAQPLIASQFPARVLAAHNAERAALGLPLVVWDNELGTAAAAYATQMASTGIFAHSDRHARRGIGENLWFGTHGAYPVESMVGAWASEKRMFAPGIFPNVSRNGNWMDVAHYTQMIWPATQRIGCALASTRQYDYLVCRYSPAGNIDGKPVP
ncbi:MAG: CAP domain-containing protein [Bacillota bacterium]